MKEIIQELLLNYTFGSLKDFKRLSSGFANENYKVETEKETVLLRICKQQTRISIQSEILMMETLRSKEFPTAYPISDKNGTYIHESEQGNIVFYDFVAGNEPEVNLETASEIGKASAKLNALAFDEILEIKQNALGLNLCDELISQFPNAKNTNIDIFTYFEEETENLRSALSADLPKAIVHGDLFPDNTLFQGNKLLAIIDFEEFCYENRLFEIGVAMNGFAFKDNKLEKDLFQSLLNAYESVSPLSKEEKKFLPEYIRYGAHAMIAWHLENNLIDTPLAHQEERVRELMARVIALRAFDYSKLDAALVG